MLTYHPTTPHIKRLLNTRKREFGMFEIPTGGSGEFNTASYYNGGSRDDYAIRDLNFNVIGYPPRGSFPDFKAHYILPIGYVLTQGGVFMGKPATIIVHYHQVDRDAVYQTLQLPL